MRMVRRRAAGAGLGGRYRRLWTAAAISNLGDGVYWAALPLLAAQLTRDPLRVSLVSFAAWLPWLLFGLVSGALVDRWERRRVLWLVDAARTLVVAVLAAAVLGGWASIPLLALVGFLLGSGQTLFDGASQAIVPAIVSRDPQRLERANAYLNTALNAGERLAGPPLGGLLFTAAAALPFALDTASFAASSALIASIPGRFAPQGAGAARSRLRSEITEGLRWLFGHRLLRALTLIVGATNLVVMAADAILVLFAQEVLGLGGAGYGLLLATLAVGGLLGSVVAAPLSRRLGAGALLSGSLLAFAAALAGFGLASRAWVAGMAWALAGAVPAVWGVVAASLRQQLIPDHLMGRVNGAGRLVGYGSIPIGALAGGLCGRLLGVRAPFLLGAGALVLVALLALPVVNNRTVEAARQGVRS